jgi:hypothetical protein
MNADELALEVAAKVADGEPVDWTDVENRVGCRIPIGPFRGLEAIARAYRSFVSTIAGRP